MPKGRCKQRIYYHISLACAIIFLTGCRAAADSPVLPVRTIIDSAELSPNLSSTMIFFSKNQNDETSVHITTLGRDEKTTITLYNEGGGVDLSHDGSYLAYRFGETIEGKFHSGIWIRDNNEEIERKVILWPEEYTIVQLNNPSFFPEEDKLIFSITWYDTDTIGLATINLDGSNLEIIETPLNTFSIGPIISPDGEKILVLCEGIDSDSGQPGFMLCIMNRDGAGRILLTENGDSHGTRLFTPDSKKIIYSETEHGGLIGLFDRPYYQIKVMDIDGANDHTILDWKYQIHVLAVSEDGEEVILIDDPENGTKKIFVINIDGTNLRHLAYFDDFLAEWYPK